MGLHSIAVVFGVYLSSSFELLDGMKEYNTYTSFHRYFVSYCVFFWTWSQSVRGMAIAHLGETARGKVSFR